MPRIDAVSTPGFLFEPDPENPGWHLWGFKEPDRFNSMLGKMIVRQEVRGAVRVRVFPGRAQSNLSDNVHGGALLGYIDVALFAASRMHGIIEAGAAVTLDLSTQFIGAAKIDQALDLVTDILKETRRLIFLRGLVEQEGAVVASYSATIRKSSPRQ